MSTDFSFVGSAALTVPSGTVDFSFGSTSGHRYWRIRALTVVGSFLEQSEARLTLGGSRVDGSATLSSSSAPAFGSVSALVDENLSTRCYWPAATANDGGFWIQWDFGSPVDVDGYQFGGFDTSDRFASALTVEWSDDASSWTVRATLTGLTYPGNFTFSSVYGFPSGDPVGTLSATLDIDGAIAATYTIPTAAGTLGATLGIDGAIAAVHARVGTLAAVLSIDGAVAGLHPRYRLHGELRDGGALVTSPRRVRAHKRSTGALIGEVDTSTGVFDIPVGYALDEFYVVPLDLASDAVDWLPPVANRVLSVLVSD